MPTEGEELMFTCAFSPDAIAVDQLPSASQIDEASAKAWEAYWMSGAAIDLSESTDPRWEELERRIVLSQYVLRVNEPVIFLLRRAVLLITVGSAVSITK